MGGIEEQWRLGLRVAESMIVGRCLSALEEIRQIASVWATQATDYDEDTEQQISDGRELMAVLERYDL